MTETPATGLEGTSFLEEGGRRVGLIATGLASNSASAAPRPGPAPPGLVLRMVERQSDARHLPHPP